MALSTRRRPASAFRALRVAGWLALAGLGLTQPRPAAAWGSYTGFRVHQFILNQAFDMLKADPAYSSDRFLLRREILAHEGVWGPGTVGWGGGPDVEGSSLYAEHYYNPILHQGAAPDSTGRHYENLVRAMVERNDGGPKAAAWSAHFLADMSVIYHVMGVDRATIQRIYNEQGGSNAVACNLPTDITGNRDHMSYTWVWSYGSNFLDSVRAYFTAEAINLNPAGARYFDYFDPWYFNGTLAESKRSSHLAYEEGFVLELQRPLSSTPTRFAEWVNPAPSFNAPWSAQRANAKKLAEATALITRGNTAAWSKDVSPALDQAIQTVFTLWRASISALVPKLATEPAAEPNCYTVKGTARNVAKLYPATGVQLRLTVLSGGVLKEGEATQSIKGSPSQGMLSPGSETEDLVWVVESEDVKNCLLRLEVIGGFDLIPDLQYARLEQYIETVEVENSVLFLMDCSGSMAGEKLANTKAAVESQLVRLDEQTEVAVMAFNDGAWSVTPFLIMTPAALRTTVRGLAGLHDGGGTALAAAIRAAGNAIRYHARGKLKRALVIQSDGEETCGGDPVAAIAEVNAQTIEVQGAP